MGRREAPIFTRKKRKQHKAYSMSKSSHGSNGRTQLASIVAKVSVDGGGDKMLGRVSLQGSVKIA